MLEVYVDGASAGNPGVSGIGIYITGEGHLIKLSEPIEATNNHTAEFIALLRGVEEAAKLTTGMVSVRSDSKVVVQSIEKEFVKNDLHMAYVTKILQTASQFEYFFIKWIPDTQNRAADALARQAIQKQKRS